MRQCDSKSLQSARKMCFWRDSWERAIIFIQYLYPNDTRPQARKSRKQYADLCEVGDRTVLRSRVRRYCKNVGFSWPVDSSVASRVPLYIV